MILRSAITHFPINLISPLVSMCGSGARILSKYHIGYEKNVSTHTLLKYTRFHVNACAPYFTLIKMLFLITIYKLFQIIIEQGSAGQRKKGHKRQYDFGVTVIYFIICKMRECFSNWYSFYTIANPLTPFVPLTRELIPAERFERENPYAHILCQVSGVIKRLIT